MRLNKNIKKKTIIGAKERQCRRRLSEFISKNTILYIFPDYASLLNPKKGAGVSSAEISSTVGIPNASLRHLPNNSGHLFIFYTAPRSKGDHGNGSEVGVGVVEVVGGGIWKSEEQGFSRKLLSLSGAETWTISFGSSFQQRSPSDALESDQVAWTAQKESLVCVCVCARVCVVSEAGIRRKGNSMVVITPDGPRKWKQITAPHHLVKRMRARSVEGWFGV